jgi:gliding motility-associated-like protein
MTRVCLLVSLFFLIPLSGIGQCTNPATISLSSTSGSICGTVTVTVRNNTFGGSATSVTLKDDGSGSVSPSITTISPFTFVYTPKTADIGRVVLITVTTNDPAGACTSVSATYTLMVNAIPSAPVVGTRTQPTCSVATGSVVLSGLPSSGTWIITRSPGGITTTGTGTSTTISGLVTGTYTFTVTSSAGCISSSSSSVVINAQPASPGTPVSTVDCALGFGKAVVNVTSPVGTGLQYMLDGGPYQSGTTFSNVANGIHVITVRNSSGCTTTGTNFQVNCGCVNQPFVVLSSSSGTTCATAPLTVSGNTFGGSATSVTITENGAGTVSPLTSGTSPFSFTYTPAAGDAGNTVIITITTNNPLGVPCAAATASYTVTVNANPAAPIVGTITHPTCTVATGSVILSGLPSTGTWRLVRSPGSVITTDTGTSTTVSGLPAGTYTFSVINANNCTSASSANVVINTQPLSPSAPVIGTITQPTCAVATGTVALSGLPATGSWTIIRTPGGVTTTGTGTSTTISGLPPGTFTFTVTNSSGCISASSASVVIIAQSSSPTAPVVGTITRPTCTVSTGGVLLTALPASGAWTLVRTPGGVITTGSGTTFTVSALPEGTYTFTVSNSAGCISPPSANVVIPAQPLTPAAPVVGTISPPTCSVTTGSVVLNGLPATGTWILTRYPGTVTSSGSGTSTTVSGLSSGIYNFMVTNSGGCVSLLSANVVIPSQPVTPPAPLIGTVTQPVYSIPTGSVVLNGLPETGTWILTLIPGSITILGTGTSRTVSGLSAGTYSFTVTNSTGCTSPASANVIINAPPGAPLVVINNPAPLCFPSTADLTAPEITAGSASDLTYSYWTDAAATIHYNTPLAATAGTYYIKGTTSSGYFTVKPVVVTIYHVPQAYAGPDQVLEYVFGTNLNAVVQNDYETGGWSLISGSGQISDTTYARASVIGLSLNENKFLWTVKNKVCPSSSDTVTIIVNDLLIPTLITPNMDGINDYLVLRGIENLGKTELLVFNRGGIQVYKNGNYDNLWNGVDNNGELLPDGTYFYVLKTANGKAVSGYIVIRR